METPLTDSINALTQYANETTGKQDTTLSDAVGSLVEGYGGENSGVKTDSGIAYIETDSTTISITHNLEGAPDFAYIFADIDDNDSMPYGGCYMQSYGKLKITNLPNTRTDSMPYTYVLKHETSGNYLNGMYNNSQPVTSHDRFVFQRGGTDWKALDTNGNPIPYKWVVGRFTT